MDPERPLAANIHVSKTCKIHAQGDISWSTVAISQNVVRAVISEVVAKHERPTATPT